MKKAPMPFFIIPVAKQLANKVLSSFVTPNVTNHLNYLESELSATGWFAGTEMTAADIMMSFPLEAAAARANLKDSYPNLNAFLNKIQVMDSYKRALDNGLPYQLG